MYLLTWTDSLVQNTFSVFSFWNLIKQNINFSQVQRSAICQTTMKVIFFLVSTVVLAVTARYLTVMSELELQAYKELKMVFDYLRNTNEPSYRHRKQVSDDSTGVVYHLISLSGFFFCLNSSTGHSPGRGICSVRAFVYDTLSGSRELTIS